MKEMQYRKLPHGEEQISILGLGTSSIQEADEREIEDTVRYAVECGINYFDMASAEAKPFAAYGRALVSERKKIYYQIHFGADYASGTYGWTTNLDQIKRSVEWQLKALQTDYIDLYLIHQPFGDYYGSWRAMEKLQRDGCVRAIGVCNFSPDRLIDLCMNQETTPAVNQIEMHPFFHQKEAIKIMDGLDVAPEAWGPLCEGQKNIFQNKVLKAVAEKHGRTVAQVILRWHVQRGVIAIPKTVHRERMAENMDIWDFELTEREMGQIETLDMGYSEIIDHRCWCTAKQLNRLKIHA